MNIDAGLVRRAAYYLIVVAIANTAIAGALTLFAPSQVSFWINFVYSQLIGLSILSLLNMPRLVLRRDQRLGAWQSALLLAGATVAGFLIGSETASWLLDMPSLLSPPPGGERSLAVILLVTVAASVGCSIFFWTRERVASLHLEAAHERARAETERARAEAASRMATEAQLNLIRTQLEPHMLFNTLANLRSLMTIDPQRAQRMMDHLIAYLRATLTASRRETVTLGAEFGLLRDYLELIAIRMGPRLRFDLDLPAPLANMPVLPLLLQPLVENAVRHGIEPAVAGGHIAVVARQHPGHLILTVEDSGLGFEPGSMSGDPARSDGGFGLAQIRERLRAAYGPAATLRIDSPPPNEAGAAAHVEVATGSRLTLDIPLPTMRQNP